MQIDLEPAGQIRRSDGLEPGAGELCQPPLNDGIVPPRFELRSCRKLHPATLAAAAHRPIRASSEFVAGFPQLSSAFVPSPRCPFFTKGL